MDHRDLAGQHLSKRTNLCASDKRVIILETQFNQFKQIKLA